MFKFLLSIAILILSCGMAHADGFQNYNVNQPYLYKYASAATTISTIKVGAGILHTLTIEGGTSSVVNIYDGSIPVSGAQIAGFTSTNALATYTFDVGFSSGCTVQSSGALQYTVSYLWLN